MFIIIISFYSFYLKKFHRNVLKIEMCFKIMLYITYLYFEENLKLKNIFLFNTSKLSFFDKKNTEKLWKKTGK